CSFQSFDLGLSGRREFAGAGYLSGAVYGDVFLRCLLCRNEERTAPPGVFVRGAGAGLCVSRADRLDRASECRWGLLLTEPAMAHVAGVFTAFGADSVCRHCAAGMGG